MSEEKDMPEKMDGELSIKDEDPIIRHLHRIIRYAVRALAVLMTLVILWGIGDVIWLIYKQLLEPPFMLLSIHDIFIIFGAFLAVLIAIEIFLNITLYLRKDVIHVELVIATALMAIARKVIVFDYDVIQYSHIWATASVVLALGITYWLLKKEKGINNAR